MTKEDFPLTLHFGDQDTVDYIQRMCRRKGVALEQYILDNFEWDDKPECLTMEFKGSITTKTCKGCDWSEGCPDVKHKKERKKR